MFAASLSAPRNSPVLSRQALEHALLIEYRPGAGIGWHRDRPQFRGRDRVSLLASCTLPSAPQGEGRLDASIPSQPIRVRPICCEGHRAQSGSTASTARDAALFGDIPDIARHGPKARTLRIARGTARTPSEQQTTALIFRSARLSVANSACARPPLQTTCLVACTKIGPLSEAEPTWTTPRGILIARRDCPTAENFARNESKLSDEALQVLAKHLFDALYDPETDLLRHANKPQVRPLCASNYPPTLARVRLEAAEMDGRRANAGTAAGAAGEAAAEAAARGLGRVNRRCNRTA